MRVSKRGERGTMHGEPEDDGVFVSTDEAGAFDPSKTTQWVRRDAPRRVLDPDQERALRFPPPNPAAVDAEPRRLGHFGTATEDPPTGTDPGTAGLPRTADPAPPPPVDLPADDGDPTSESLRPDRLLRNRRRPPASGWRRLVYRMTGGAIHPPPSKLERHRHDLVERIRQPVAKGHFRVAVMSLKGGVGKTTTTIALGSTLAAQRGDRIIAVDANPDRGTLSDKLRLESPATIRDLLNDRGGIRRYADVRSYTSQAPSRLEVLASDRDPAISEAFNAADYAAVAEILDQFYSIAITDCGTGMLHSAMSAILAMADQIILVSPITVDGARSASATLDWLQAHGHRPLASNAVVVLSAIKNLRRNAVDVDELKGHFSRRCRAVIGVPFDPHLEEGYEVDLDLLRPRTRDTYLELGAAIADAFHSRDPL
ncbi:MinD/ParA family ATP-binding protein [Nonomuraea sediminis]|uniref:MinD/ParA family ATP-binding protein n=1 Tax=Nonomuraea sediminis TaxID=2835864 RepID=UPI001BDC4CCC|nr:MinD/ParA family protein [Nonomuraea sediminis]